MASEVFRRVGRGGAGNWYSKKDVEDADKAAPEDIEAQNQGPSPAPASTTTQSHGGRGGAGNFVDPSTADEARRQEREETERTKAAVTRNVAKPKAGLSGRGGMGNWSGDVTALDAAAAQEEERKKREELEAKIMQDVEAVLPMPPPAYHHQGRDQDEK